MRIEKNRILKCEQVDVLVVDYLFHLGDHYVLTITIDSDRKLTNQIQIFKEKRQDNNLYLTRVKDKQTLGAICPLFERNIKRNLI